MNIAFMSPSRGMTAKVNLPTHWNVFDWAFLSSGQLRMAAMHRVAAGLQQLEFLGIDPTTGSFRSVASFETAATAGNIARVVLDASGTKALIVAGAWTDARVSLLTFHGAEPVTPRTLASGVPTNFDVRFLGDGRIALQVRHPPTAELRLFTPDGDPLVTVPLGEGFSMIGSEPFVNVLAVSTLMKGKSGVALLDTTNGAILRQLAGLYTVAHWTSVAPPPPGSAGARMLMSADRKIYLLPSLTEEPRQLLPRP